MMPTPTHLRECTVRTDAVTDEAPFESRIVCVCGRESFQVLHSGGIQKIGGQDFPVVAEIDGNYFLVITAKCTYCHREHLLLDADFHGWNGWVCRDEAQASLPRPTLVTWPCRKCRNDSHTIKVTVFSEGKADFMEETAGELDQERWYDAFSWINMDIRCNGCGTYTKDFVSYETM